MNIFEEEVRKMAEEIARQERANMDSASERIGVASDVSRDLVAYIGSNAVAEFRKAAQDAIDAIIAAHTREP
jgi:hypothetical protein